MNFSNFSFQWIFSGPRSQALGAAFLLVAIQVSIGIVMKASQTNNGQYAFSVSASVAISEFGKLLLSTMFFYRECGRRRLSEREESGRYTTIQQSDAAEAGENQPFIDPTDAPESSLQNSRIEDRPEPSPKLTPRELWRLFLKEISVDARYGFAKLALLYALINNTIFVSYKLADPGTIMLTRSLVTLITALVMMSTIGTRLSRIQWLAIVLQVAGLIVTQYRPDTGTSYPVTTYLILLFQVFLTAVSGVYNQALLKAEDASMHASNAMLYSVGVVINVILHIVIGLLNDDEPGFFVGFGSVGAVLVILSNVFIGLAITAVYKYADAIIKCLATAVSTGILLYISPIFFGTDLSFLVLPGTVVVMVSSWLYMEGGLPKQSAPQKEVDNINTNEQPSKSKQYRHTILAVSSTATVMIVSALALSKSSLPDFAQHHDQPTDISKPSNTTYTSPFANTLAFIRWNSEHPERMPLLHHYDPFFAGIHYSMPHYLKPPFSPDYHNLTHDSYENSLTIYLAVARNMQQILDDPTSTMTGLLYFHFDTWVDPLDFSGENFDNIWLPDIQDVGGRGPQFECMTDRSKHPTRWPFFPSSKWQIPAILAAQAIDSLQLEYKIDPDEWCVGWMDFYYIPRRFFADFIFLSQVYAAYETFQEIAIPSMMHIIDSTRRDNPTRTVLSRFGDCWGSCCEMVQPDVHDVLFHRCGHKFNYQADKANQSGVIAHYEKLERYAGLLGTERTVNKWGKGKFGAALKAGLEGVVEGAGKGEAQEGGEGDIVGGGVKGVQAVDPKLVDEAKKEMDRLEAEMVANLEKVTAAPQV